MNSTQEKSGNTAHLDVSLIPPPTQAFLAETIMGMYKNFLKQPGGREALDAEKKRLGLC